MKNNLLKILIAILLCSNVSFAGDEINKITEDDIPQNAANWMHRERHLNERKNDTSAFSPLDMENELPREYDPKYGAIFEIGYLDIPINEAEYLEGLEMSQKTRSFFIVETKNKKYVRYFIHPDMEEHNGIKKAIKEYGLPGADGKKYLGKGGYIAAPTSSPRSLLVWHRNRPSEFYGVKVSMSRKIGGTSRLNDYDKLTRSHAVSNTFSIIPKNILEEYNFGYFPEVFQVVSPGNKFGNIVRQFGDKFKDKDQVPGFSLTAPGKDGDDPILYKVLKKRVKNSYDIVVEEFLRPLIRSYTYQVWVEGLLGEQHQQNVTFEQNKNGTFQVKVNIKDMDAFRIDPEMRALNYLSLSPFQDEPSKPQAFFKFGKSIADGGNDQFHFIVTSYNNYIRNNWAFLYQEFFKKYGKRLGISYAKDLDNGKRIWRDIDRLFFQESLNFMEPEILFGQLNPHTIYNLAKKQSFFTSALKRKAKKAMNGELEEEFKLTKKEALSLLETYSVAEILNFAESDHKYPIFIASDIYERFKVDRRKKYKRINIDQTLLREEYKRLIDNYRALKKKSSIVNSKDLEYVLADGAILVYKDEKIYDVALFEPDNAKLEKYYKDALSKGHPRKMRPEKFNSVFNSALKKIREMNPYINRKGKTCLDALMKVFE